MLTLAADLLIITTLIDVIFVHKPPLYVASHEFRLKAKSLAVAASE